MAKLRNPISNKRDDSQAAIALYDEIKTDADFLALAQSYGVPIQNDDGTYLKTLTVKSHEDAPAHTLSAVHGRGMFPFHTDTAFWPLPARLVLLRAVDGDLRRCTYVKTFKELLKDINSDLIGHSVWLCDTGSRKYYTTLSFFEGNIRGFRYDANCMKPVNYAAELIHDVLQGSIVATMNSVEITWKPNRVAVISNWLQVHARGPSCDNEANRSLQRIYLH